MVRKDERSVRIYYNGPRPSGEHYSNSSDTLSELTPESIKRLGSISRIMTEADFGLSVGDGDETFYVRPNLEQESHLSFTIYPENDAENSSYRFTLLQIDGSVRAYTGETEPLNFNQARDVGKAIILLSELSDGEILNKLYEAQESALEAGTNKAKRRAKKIGKLISNHFPGKV